jgi:hypothetical protein
MRRFLRGAGTVVLLVLQLGAAALLVVATVRRERLQPAQGIPATTPDVLGAVAWYTDDGFAAAGVEGYTIVRLGSATVLRGMAGRASVADLLPGAGIAAWGRDPAQVIVIGGVPR